jgi:hypothetical protein
MPEKTAKIGDRIDVLRVELNKTVRELERGDGTEDGENWVVSNGLLGKWRNRPVTFQSNTLEDFLNFWGVSKEWWKTGQLPVLNKNLTSVEKLTENNNMDQARETFYRDLIERNEEYSILPKALLKDYKMIPDKIMDQITKTNDELKSALVDKYERYIKTLEQENQDLRKRLNLP